MHFQRWRVFAPLGLGLVGFGASLLGYSIELRVESVPIGRWFLWGTLALVVLNSGVAVFGEAIKHRVLYDLQREQTPDT